MRKPLLVLVGLLALAVAAVAKTPDGQPPSEETVCDNEVGAAFGLCNAYCEAMDCDSPDHRASARACEQVKRNFERKTGRPLPCEATCPCGGLLRVFGGIESGEIDVVECLRTDEVVVAITDDDDLTGVYAGEPPVCNDNLQPPAVDLTSTEHLLCRVALCAACAAQGVPCRSPE